MADQKVLALVNGEVAEVTVTTGGGAETVLKVDGGQAATVFPDYLLRLDFGRNGASINPSGTP